MSEIDGIELGMNPRTKLVAIMILAVACQTWSSMADDRLSVTVSQLLTNPSKFDGKRVSVVGYYVNEFGKKSDLFVDRKVSGVPNSRASVWVDETALFNPVPPSPGMSETCELKDHYVRIMGVFHYKGIGADRGFGWGRSRTCELAHIVYFRVALKSADDPINPCAMYPKK